MQEFSRLLHNFAREKEDGGKVAKKETDLLQRFISAMRRRKIARRLTARKGIFSVNITLCRITRNLTAIISQYDNIYHYLICVSNIVIQRSDLLLHQLSFPCNSRTGFHSSNSLVPEERSR